MTAHFPWAWFMTGVALFAAGWLHRWRPAEQVDQRVFLVLHRWLRRAVWFFKALWPVGTMAGMLLAAGVAAILRGWQFGVLMLVVYGVITQGEMLIKRTLTRQRPFQVLPAAQMGQPREPHDASFPSGDALRVWLIACVLGAWLPAPWCGLLASVATLVSLGRIALGVHFPLDVIGGAGLGLVAAALVVWLGELLPVFLR